MNSIKVGDRVKVTTKNAVGEVVFIGQTHFSKGVWFGVILDDAKGQYDGVVDGIRYFKCPMNRGIFVKADLIQKEFVDTSCDSDMQHKLLPNEIKCFNYLKSSYKLKSNKYSNPPESEDIYKTQSKNEACEPMNKRIGNTNVKKNKLQELKECRKKIDTTYVLHSPPANTRIKYPNYLKASSKITFSHICLAKNVDPDKKKCQPFKKGRGICNNKSNRSDGNKNAELVAVKKETEELKVKLKNVEESLQEILSKVDKTGDEIILLKEQIDCQRKQNNYQECYLKLLLERKHSNLSKINKSFVSVFNDKLNPSASRFGSESIETMISRQRALLKEQEEKTVEGLFEVKKLLSRN